MGKKFVLTEPTPLPLAFSTTDRPTGSALRPGAGSGRLDLSPTWTERMGRGSEGGGEMGNSEGYQLGPGVDVLVCGADDGQAGGVIQKVLRAADQLLDVLVLVHVRVAPPAACP
eukprot:CAMPEP_0173326816 /NCGR_PEP_ID=MMETSP1144-20121109/1270_1 /TAXON_ID=483371 /ORGANISM="non described non described, Strain CCMP2298" /LENGTH=113 /DNA_ID=CAMNT_0014271157 /DNA_START=917 /DNA_END=1256 /DNA_ORIENTATION=-